MSYLWFVLIGIGIVIFVLFLGAIIGEISHRVKNKKLKRVLEKISDFITDNFDPVLP